MNTPLLMHLLDLLFQDPRTHSQVKDRLSDWILDRRALGLTLDDFNLLEYLQTVHPKIFGRLKENPRVKDEIERVLAAQYSRVSQPNPTGPSCACGATVPQEIAEYATTQFGEVVCVPCQQRRFKIPSRWR